MNNKLKVNDYISIAKNRRCKNLINELYDYIFYDLRYGIDLAARENTQGNYVPIYSTILKKGLN